MTTIKKAGYKFDVRTSGNFPKTARKALFVGLGDDPVGLSAKPGNPVAALLFEDNETAWAAMQDLVLPHPECFSPAGMTPYLTMRVDTLSKARLGAIPYACVITRSR